MEFSSLQKISHPLGTMMSSFNNMNRASVSLEDNRPSSLIQRKRVDAMASNSMQSTIQKKENKTGLPDNLKTGIENLSGRSMDDVKVHYNSSRPAQLNAHAYAQGNQIHLASGQEKHLPHEAWHVVQQKQGRVKPTMQMKAKIPINDDAVLEKEADVMGARALHSFHDTKALQKKATRSFSDANTPFQLEREDDVNEQTGLEHYVIEVELPGSGDDHWRSTPEASRGTRMDDPEDANTTTHWERGNTERKYTLTVAGPGGPSTKGLVGKAGGVIDRGGSNSIDRNIAFTTKQIRNMVGHYRYVQETNGTTEKPILILIKAHSRNAVASTQIAQILKQEIPVARIELVAFDPVPGPGHFGDDIVTSIARIPTSTLIYSVATQHAVGFTPQKVFGAKRIIISRQHHGGGLEHGYIYNGKAYHGSMLNSLPEGVYIDSNATGSTEIPMMKVDSIGDALHNLQLEFERSDSTSRDAGRLGIIAEVLRYYYEHHRPPVIPRDDGAGPSSASGGGASASISSSGLRKRH